MSTFANNQVRLRYWATLGMVSVMGALCAFGLFAYNNPMPVNSEVFWLIARRRMDAIIAMFVVALCQALATVAFQTVTNNRIITPSIMGFESLYVAINTSIVYLFGITGLMESRTLGMLLTQIGLMVGLSLLLYSWLLSGNNNLHAMLLLGIVIGGGLASVSTFMKRLLTPSEFDILSARLFGSVNNADSSYYPVVLPLCFSAAIALYLLSRRLNVISLGREVAINLGLNYRATTVGTLVLVSILMAVSTALVGPMTFLGFLVATLTYQFSGTYNHRYVFPMAFATGFAILTMAYFLMNHVFYAQGVVSIIIELVGGCVFLAVILRKRRL